MIGTSGASLGKWARLINANDTDTAMTVNQDGAGNIVDFQDGGVSVFKIADGGAFTMTGPLTLADDGVLGFGAGADGAMLYETADSNALMLVLGLPHVDENASNVAVLALVDRDAVTTDLGAGGVDLSGITQPSLIVVDEDSDSFIRISHEIDDVAMISSDGVIEINATSAVAIGTGEGGTTAATGETLRAPSIAAGGTGNVAGADLTITPGAGTGTGDVGQIIFQTYQVAGAGDNLQTTLETILTLDEDLATFAKAVEIDGGIAGGGNAPVGYFQNQLRGNFTSDGASSAAAKLVIADRLTGATGDTTYLAHVRLNAETFTQAAAEAIGHVASLSIVEPDINIGTATVTVAASLYIANAPTEGTSQNAAVYVASGDLILAAGTNGSSIDLGSENLTVTTAAANRGLHLISSVAGTLGPSLKLYHDSVSPAVNDLLAIVQFYGRNSVAAETRYGYMTIRIVDPVDAQEDMRWEWYGINAGVGDNEAMRLTGAGGLSVDADIGTADDPVALFDTIPTKYGVDDAEFLARMTPEKVMDLRDIGVLDTKATGSGNMLNIQKAVYLGWGGIAANRNYINRLEARVAELETLMR